MPLLFWRRQADPIDALIAEKGVAKDPEGNLQHRYVGHDDSLRVESLRRRKRAEQMKTDALKLDTADDARSRIQLVR